METVEVLMIRDGLSKADAVALVEATLKACMENPYEASEIWTGSLYLSPECMLDSVPDRAQ